MFQFPGPWEEEREGGCGKRRELGCQTDVITEFVPSQSRVYSCLQRRTQRLLRRRSCRSSNRSVEGFPAHEIRTRSIFKPTPEGSTSLVNALQTAQILLLFSFFLSFFLFKPHLDFFSIFPIFILSWRSLKICRQTIAEKSKTHLAPCFCWFPASCYCFLMSP